MEADRVVSPALDGPAIGLPLDSGKGGSCVYFLVEAYPSAYHPPPFNSKVQGLIIFLAFFSRH